MNRQADFERFLMVLTAVADYYGKELSEGVIELYWQGLEQYDIEAVEKGLWEHARNPDSGQWMPKIADIVKMLQGRTADQAQQAWSKVDAAVRRIGTYSDVVFDDAVIHRVISDMGGWIAFGTKTEDEWPFVAKEFENRYRGYRMRNETPEYLPVLTGMANAHNQKEGFRTQPPRLIGNAQKAEQVMLGGTNQPLIPMQMAAGAARKALELAYEEKKSAA